ncbi:MAG: hypothetical protein IKJ67_01060 [Bacteroidales bacterium]|nr:hypothetical protein [Bacteroidales bacterium]
MKAKINSFILLMFSTVMFFSCEKENNDIFSESKWQLVGHDFETINDSNCTLEFDDNGNVSIGGSLDIPYSINNDVISFYYDEPSGTMSHHFILSDDKQSLKILNNFHSCSLTQDIWDTTYFRKVN